MTPNLSEAPSASGAELLSNSQFTTSEIIAFLNQYDTPPFVYERMFAAPEMYYFNAAELRMIERGADDQQTARLARSAEIQLTLLRSALRQETPQQPPAASPPSPATTTNPTTDPGQILRAEVMRLQNELARVGCNPGLADGVIGPATRSAARQFSELAGLNYENALSNLSDFADIVQRTPSDFCPRQVQFFSRNWTGNFSCDYMRGSVNATISAQSSNSFSMSLVFRKNSGHPRQPERATRQSQFTTDGNLIRANQAAKPNSANCPDGSIVQEQGHPSNLRSMCPVRPIEGGERLSGQFANNRRNISFSGLLYPMGRCSIEMAAR